MSEAPLEIGIKMSDQLTLPGNSTVPHLTQWFGWWHYEPQRAAALYDTIRKMDVGQHVRQWKQSDEKRAVSGGYSYVVSNGVATLELTGSLMKHVSSMDDGTSTVAARRTVRSMQNDGTVKAAIILIDSPGGTVAGAYDLADDIKALAAAKPTYAYVSDLAASAGYLQASQTRSISANRTALVGCIGTFGVMYDYSEMFKNEGVKAIVISSGGFKGAGVPGTEITDDQVKEWQREIDALNDAFINAVMSGRKMDRAKASALADGRTHIADEAQKLGLIDRVESFDDLCARVQQEISGRPTSRSGTKQEQPTGGSAAGDSTAAPEGAEQEATMAEENKSGAATKNEPQPASIKDLKQEFKDDPAFALEAAENAWTMQEAKANYCDRLREKQRQQADESPEPKGGVGNRPLESGPASKSRGKSAGGDAVAEFNDAVAEQMTKPGYSNRQKAIRAVASADPELHRSYLEACNPGRRKREMIADRFESPGL